MASGRRPPRQDVLDAQLVLLVHHFRDAGPRGLTKKEMRAHGVRDTRQALADLRGVGVRFRVERSRIDGAPWRWILAWAPRDEDLIPTDGGRDVNALDRPPHDLARHRPGETHTTTPRSSRREP